MGKCLLAMYSRKVKVEFSEEERLELLKAYDDGMHSVSKDRLPKIQELALRFNKEEKEIKVCFIVLLAQPHLNGHITKTQKLMINNGTYSSVCIKLFKGSRCTYCTGYLSFITS